MNDPEVRYDELSDTLTVVFAMSEAATGVELNDHIVLRLNKVQQQAVSLIFLDYSLLVQPDELGVRQFPLTGLAALSDELRNTVVNMLKSAPIKNYLALSVYTPSFAGAIPIVSVKSVLVAA